MKLFLVVLLLFTAWGAAGQRTLLGRTVTADGSPVEGVSVSVEGSGVGTTTDRLGSFSLRVPERLADDTLSVTHVAYGEVRAAVATFKNGTNITLVPRPVVGAEVVVEGGRVKRVTLEIRGDNIMGWAWSFRPELAEFGSFIMVEEQFLVHNFRFKVLKDPEVPTIKAQLIVYRIDSPYMVGVMQQEIQIVRREPNFSNTDDLGRWLDFDYRQMPFPGPKEEEGGFIRLNDTELRKLFPSAAGQDNTMSMDVRETFPVLPEYNFTVTPNEELILDRGIYFVALKFVASAENVNLMSRYPWVFPQFGAFNEPGLLRRGDSFEFEGSDRNAGIIMVGYGK
jgi:hypothetical protein